MTMTINSSLVVDFNDETSDKTDTLFIHLTNLLRDFEAHNHPIHIDVVVYGKAVLHFLKDSAYEDKIAPLHEAGVAFYACRNAMNVLEIDEIHLTPHMAITPSGVAKITQLQLEGSVYLKG